MLSDIFDVIKLFAFIAVPIVFIVFLITKCVNDSHVPTEANSTSMLELQDIQYKGHTYIYVHGNYSRTLVHAEHCKCKK